MNGFGRTKSEALSYFSALGDVEDLKAAARARKAFEDFQLAESDSWSGDTSAPSETDVAEHREMLRKGKAIQKRNAELRRIKSETLAEVYRRWIPRGVR